MKIYRSFSGKIHEKDSLKYKGINFVHRKVWKFRYVRLEYWEVLKTSACRLDIFEYFIIQTWWICKLQLENMTNLRPQLTYLEDLMTSTNILNWSWILQLADMKNLKISTYILGRFKEFKSYWISLSTIEVCPDRAINILWKSKLWQKSICRPNIHMFSQYVFFDTRAIELWIKLKRLCIKMKRVKS